MPPGILNPIPEGITGRGAKTVRAVYDFAVDGGAVGTIPLLGSTDIPNGALVMGGYMEVHTIVAGAGATAAVQCQAANDIISAAAVSGAPWSTTGLKAVVPLYTATTMIRLTAARDISLVITAAVLTAGRFSVVLFYQDPLV
jgi:hypothetical protein